MKKLEILQMENLQGGSVKACYYAAGVAILGGAITEIWGVSVFGAAIALGCAAYDY